MRDRKLGKACASVDDGSVGAFGYCGDAAGKPSRGLDSPNAPFTTPRHYESCTTLFSAKTKRCVLGVASARAKRTLSAIKLESMRP